MLWLDNDSENYAALIIIHKFSLSKVKVNITKSIMNNIPIYQIMILSHVNQRHDYDESNILSPIFLLSDKIDQKSFIITSANDHKFQFVSMHNINNNKDDNILIGSYGTFAKKDNDLNHQIMAILSIPNTSILLIIYENGTYQFILFLQKDYKKISSNNINDTTLIEKNDLRFNQISSIALSSNGMFLAIGYISGSIAIFGFNNQLQLKLYRRILIKDISLGKVTILSWSNHPLHAILICEWSNENYILFNRIIILSCIHLMIVILNILIKKIIYYIMKLMINLLINK